MHKWLATTSCAALILAGCGGEQTPPRASGQNASLANPNTATAVVPSGPAPVQGKIPTNPNEPIALVNNRAITLEQLQRPLVEAYGLNFLLHLVQLEYAKQMATAAGVTVTPKDIDYERTQSALALFRQSFENADMSEEEKVKEAERLIDPFLANQRLSRQEFDMAVETSAYLRKLAEPGLREKISEENLQQAFKIMYGERVRVRHIQVRNARELAEVQRMLGEGKAFEAVAMELSIDARSRAQGGLIRPFSMAEPMWPQAFKEAAFALKEPGELSQPVSTGDSIHLIKLEQKIPPNSAVKFEDHREIVRDELYNRLLQVRMQQLREQMQADAPKAMKIEHPVLRRQYIDRMEKLNAGSPADPARVRRQIELNQGNPNGGDQAAPEGRDEVARPPATMPARP